MSKKYAGATRSTGGQSAESDYTVSDPQAAWARFEGLMDKILKPASMSEPAHTLSIPQEVHDEAKEMIQEGFRGFADHSKRLAEDLAEFNKKRKEVRGNIKDGARRTSGRIV